MNNNDFTFNTSFKTPKKKPSMTPKQVRTIMVLAVILLVIIIGVSSSFYTVDEKQQGVVTTFGKKTDITSAGIHFKLPFGIQNVDLVDSNIYQKIEIGYRTRSDGTVETVSNESKMITGDFNIVNVDFFVEYKISDPYQYLYASENPVEILKMITQSQIRNVISSYPVDAVLTSGKDEIQVKVKELIQEQLAIYNIGLNLTDIKIQDAEPPTDEVTEAFKAVETAKQNRETAINEAQAYENAELPKAEAQADQLIKNAEFKKQDRINEAIKQVAMFEAMYQQYKLNPSITRERMYYEYMEQILPGVKLYINTQSGSSDTQILLPLDSFADPAKSTEN